MVLPLFVVALLRSAPSYPSGLPPFSRALGRPLAWDPYGAYGLDAEGPVPKADAEILAQVQAGELGKAEVLCRNRLRADGSDVLPAWALGQIVRVRRTGADEYRRFVEGHVAEPASPAVLLYRLHVCRSAFNGTMGLPYTKDKFDRRQVVYGEMRTLCDLLRPCADAHLGVAIAITQISPSYALSNRATLESYRRANPKGADVRPLLCQAYNGGVGYGLAVFEDGHREKLSHPDEPQPKKALEVALSILKDRPDDPLGHFHAGRSYARMELVRTKCRPHSMRADSRLSTRRRHSSTSRRATKTPSSPKPSSTEWTLPLLPLSKTSHLERGSRIRPGCGRSGPSRGR